MSVQNGGLTHVHYNGKRYELRYFTELGSSFMAIVQGDDLSNPELREFGKYCDQIPVHLLKEGEWLYLKTGRMTGFETRH